MVRLFGIQVLIALLMLSGIAKGVPNSMTNAIPFGYHIIDSAITDFNNDKLPDYALVIDSNLTAFDSFPQTKKLLIFLTSKKNKAHYLSVQLYKLLLPFSDISHNPGYFIGIDTSEHRLVIKYKILKSDTTEFEYYFKYENYNWFLVNITRNIFLEKPSYPGKTCQSFGIDLKTGYSYTCYMWGEQWGQLYACDHFTTYWYKANPLALIQNFEPMSQSDPQLSLTREEYIPDFFK